MQKWVSCRNWWPKQNTQKPSQTWIIVLCRRIQTTNKSSNARQHTSRLGIAECFPANAIYVISPALFRFAKLQSLTTFDKCRTRSTHRKCASFFSRSIISLCRFCLLVACALRPSAACYVLWEKKSMQNLSHEKWNLRRLHKRSHRWMCDECGAFLRKQIRVVLVLMWTRKIYLLLMICNLSDMMNCEAYFLYWFCIPNDLHQDCHRKVCNFWSIISCIW